MKECFSKKSIWILVVLLIVSMISAQSVIVDSDAHFEAGNVTYTVETRKDFSSLKIGADFVIFNNTANFSITSANSVLIEILYLHPTPGTTASGTKILSFNATVASGLCTFNIGLPRAQSLYDIYIDSVLVYDNRVSSVSGVINFVHSSWSEHTFDIYYDELGDGGGGYPGDGGGDDSTVPGEPDGGTISVGNYLWLAVLAISIIIVISVIYMFGSGKKKKRHP